MKKLGLILVMVFSMCLVGCSMTQEKITVESRTYKAAIGERVTYGTTSKEQVVIVPNAVVYQNSKYNLEALITSVGKNSITVKFSQPIFCTTSNKNGDIFVLQKNRTYDFCLGSVEGVEVKLRYI